MALDSVLESLILRADNLTHEAQIYHHCKAGT
jgi:hypothetical protein